MARDTSNDIPRTNRSVKAPRKRCALDDNVAFVGIDREGGMKVCVVLTPKTFFHPYQYIELAFFYTLAESRHNTEGGRLCRNPRTHWQQRGGPPVGVFVRCYVQMR